MQKNAKVVKILLDSLPFIRIFRGEIIVIKYGGAAQSSLDLKEKFALDIVMMYMLGKILLDSLPFIRIFRGEIIVIKYGGAAQSSLDLKEKFALDIVMMYMLGLKPVIIHGGGKRINEVLERLKIPSQFVNGYRVTCEDSMRVVEMVLSGEINKELTAFLNFHGAKAVGISGKDANLLQARAKDNGTLGYTGEITKVNPEFLLKVIDEGFVPIIAPIANGEGKG